MGSSPAIKIPPYDQRALERFCQEQGIALVILFGSRATGQGQSVSDLDLALQPSTPDLKVPLLEVLDTLDQIFGRRFQIDPVVLNTDTDPVLRHEIFAQGVPLYEQRPGFFVDESYRAWVLFQDTAFIREMRKRYLDVFVEQRGDRGS